MNRQETDREARATKNVKHVWKWILGVGIALSLFAWLGGLFNHGGNAGESDTPSEQSSNNSGNASMPDTTMQTEPDTIMEHVRGTE